VWGSIWGSPAPERGGFRRSQPGRRDWPERMKRVMYIERKAGELTGAAPIGRVSFSKTGRTIYYDGRAFQSLKGQGFKANYFEVETGEEYWISGCKKDGSTRLYGERNRSRSTTAPAMSTGRKSATRPNEDTSAWLTAEGSSDSPARLRARAPRRSAAPTWISAARRMR
jgi:hypothetical protein